MSSKDNPNDPNNSPNKMNHPLGSKENSWTLETDSLDAAIEKPKAKPAPVELDLHYNLNGEQAASLLMNLARSSSSVERKPTDTSFSTSLEVAEARRHARDSATSVVNNNHFGSHGTAGAVMAAQRITFTPAAEMETGRLVRLAQSTFGNSVNFDEDDFAVDPADVVSSNEEEEEEEGYDPVSVDPTPVKDGKSEPCSCSSPLTGRACTCALKASPNKTVKFADVVSVPRTGLPFSRPDSNDEDSDNMPSSHVQHSKKTSTKKVSFVDLTDSPPSSPTASRRKRSESPDAFATAESLFTADDDTFVERLEKSAAKRRKLMGPISSNTLRELEEKEQAKILRRRLWNDIPRHEQEKMAVKVADKFCPTSGPAAAGAMIPTGSSAPTAPAVASGPLVLTTTNPFNPSRSIFPQDIGYTAPSSMEKRLAEVRRNTAPNGQKKLPFAFPFSDPSQFENQLSGVTASNSDYYTPLASEARQTLRAEQKRSAEVLNSRMIRPHFESGSTEQLPDAEFQKKRKGLHTYPRSSGGECMSCKSWFSNPSVLVQHLLGNAGCRTYTEIKCMGCNRIFKQIHAWESHRTVDGECAEVAAAAIEKRQVAMYTRRVRSPEFVKKGEDSPYRASVNDDNWETDQKYWESMSNARGNALRQSQHQNTKSNKKQRTAGPEKTKIVIRKDEYFNPNDFSDPDHYMDQLDGPVDDDDLAEALERSRQTREYGAIVFRNRSLRSSSTAAHSGFSDDQQRVPFRSQFYANRYASASNDAVQATPVHTGGFIIGSVPLTPAMVSSGPAPPFSAAPQVPRQEHVFSYDYGQFATAPSQGSLRPKQTSVFAGANTPLQNRVVSHTYGQYTAPFLTAQAAAAMKLSLVQGYGSDSTARPVQQQQQLSLFSPPPPFVYQPQPGQQQYIMNPSAGIESPTRLGPGITYHDHTVAVMDDQTKTSVNRAGALMDTPTKPKVARNYFETPAGHQTGITAPPQTDNRTRVRPVRQPSNPPQEVEAQAAVGFPPRYLAFPARTGAPPTSFEYAPGAGIYPPAPPSMIVGPPSPRAASPSSMSVGSASATAVTSEAIFGSDDGTVAGGVAIGWNGTFCGIDLVEAGDESDSDQKEGGAAVGLNVQSRDIDLVGAGSDSESDKEHGGVPLDVSPYRTPEWKRLGYKKSEWEAAEKRRKGTETPTKEKKCGR